MASSIQFIKGVNEPTVPDVRLTRARDGSSGTASFIFKEPSVFEAGNELGDITGMFLVDDEGTLNTVDVQAKFLNGKPDRIEAKYIMRSGFEWDRCVSQPQLVCAQKHLYACNCPFYCTWHAGTACSQWFVMDCADESSVFWQIYAVHGAVC